MIIRLNLDNYIINTISVLSVDINFTEGLYCIACQYKVIEKRNHYIYSTTFIVYIIIMALISELTLIAVLTIISNNQKSHDQLAQNELRDSYSYVVIGAGAAGSVVAARLSENENVNVVVLEAGESANMFNDIPCKRQLILLIILLITLLLHSLN